MFWFFEKHLQFLLRSSTMIHNVFKSQSRHVIRENKTLLDLAVCQGEALSDERTNTCPYCVAINNTVYYSRNKCDFTHLYCKCHYESFSLTSARVIFKREKMIYFLTSNSKKRNCSQNGFSRGRCRLSSSNSLFGG